MQDKPTCKQRYMVPLLLLSAAQLSVIYTQVGGGGDKRWRESSQVREREKTPRHTQGGCKLLNVFYSKAEKIRTLVWSKYDTYGE